jgi:hypothetical protein
MGDYVRLEDGVNYGIVDDLIFDDGGKLKSIVVNPSVGYGVGGYYAYPWYGYDYGFDPGQDFYDLPYGRDDVAAYEPFDSDVYDDDIL